MGLPLLASLYNATRLSRTVCARGTNTPCCFCTFENSHSIVRIRAHAQAACVMWERDWEFCFFFQEESEGELVFFSFLFL